MISIAPSQPVLIAGPTASGKSALALHIAQTQGGVIVNADALQVFDRWRIVTARPDAADLAAAPHALYGHVPLESSYSAGQWLREVTPFLSGAARPIIVGGTGLNFNALTQGLVEIPPTPDNIRAAGNALPLGELLSALDEKTKARIDLNNRMRVQRAWEVLVNTGKPLADWQDETPAPVLAKTDAVCITLVSPTEWLNDRIARRFDMMLDAGALDEARAILPDWDPSHQSARAIGASELIRHLQGEISLEQAREEAIIGSRQYAKRQRTWFRSRHKDWHHLDASRPSFISNIQCIDGPSWTFATEEMPK